MTERKLTFCLLEGVSDPVLSNDIWFGLKLIERQEDEEEEEFLHDEL